MIDPAPDFVPILRKDLLRRQVEHETLIWSPIREDATALDPVTSVMLDVIDGEATTADLAQDVAEVVGLDAELATMQVRRILASLNGAGALETSVPHSVPERQRELFINPPST